MTTATFALRFIATNTPTKCTSSCKSTPNRSRTARRTRASSVATSLALAPVDVIDEVGVQRRDFRAALAPPLSAGRFDQAPGLVAGRVAKARAGVGQRDRLRLLAPHQPALASPARTARGLGPLETPASRAKRSRRAPASNGGRNTAPSRRAAPVWTATAPTRRARNRRSRDRCRRSCAASRRRFREFPESEPMPSAPADAALAVTAAMPGRCAGIDDHDARFRRARRSRANSAAERTTMPRIPPSPTSTLLPLPITNHGSLRLKQKRITRREFGFVLREHERVGRPADLPRRVRGASGSSKLHALAEDRRAAPRDRRASNSDCAACASSRSRARCISVATREPRGDVGNVARAEHQHHRAVRRFVENAIVQIVDARDVVARCAPRAASGSPIERSLTPGIGGSEAA